MSSNMAQDIASATDCPVRAFLCAITKCFCRPAPPLTISTLVTSFQGSSTALKRRTAMQEGQRRVCAAGGSTNGLLHAPSFSFFNCIVDTGISDTTMDIGLHRAGEELGSAGELIAGGAAQVQLSLPSLHWALVAGPCCHLGGAGGSQLCTAAPPAHLFT